MVDHIRTLLVEDEPAVRGLLERSLKNLLSVSLVDSVGTLAAARSACALHRPDLLVTDLRLPDGNGLSLIAETRAALQDARIVVISVLTDEASVVDAIRAGANGYLLKDGLPEDFEQFIHDLMLGHSTRSPAVARHIVRLLHSGALGDAATGHAIAELTKRESDVLSYIAKGLSNNDIGSRLAISPHTVGDHVKSIYQKLGVRTRGEAVFQGISRKLIAL